MAQYRFVYTSFWQDPKVMESFTPEDKLFFIYLLTNAHTTQIGIYKIPKKLMAFELGYSIESISSLLSRFEEHHKMVRYNEDTRELAIKNWGKYNLNKGGKPVIDCITKEFSQVEDRSLILYVYQGIKNQNMKLLFLEELKKDKGYKDIPGTPKNGSDENKSETDTTDVSGYDAEDGSYDDTFHESKTISGQKENKKENKNKKEDNYMSDSSEYRLAEYLFKFIKRNNPKAKEPNLQRWAKHFDYILRIDNRDLDDVKHVIKFSQSDSFWFKNILSPDKLRKQFDRLLLEIQDRQQNIRKGDENKEVYYGKESTFNSFPQRKYSKEDLKNIENKLLGLAE